jgi:hypothetical protein
VVAWLSMVVRASMVVLNNNNPSVLGLFVEQIVLSWIAVKGCSIAAEEFGTKSKSIVSTPLLVPGMASHSTAHMAFLYRVSHDSFS